MMHKIKLTDTELFLIDRLVVDERDRMLPVVREGVGLSAVAANDHLKVLYALLRKLNKCTKLRH
jgi:hypothetical protein